MLSIEEHSEAWHQARLKGIGSSEASIIAGLNPYQSIFHLWELKVGIAEPFGGNEATRRGQRLEPFIRDKYEQMNNCYVPPKHFIHPKYDWMRANLDGYNEDFNYAIEIKAPMSTKGLKDAKHGKVPDLYYPQLAWQMMVSGAKHVDYVTYNSCIDDIYVKRVYPDLKFQRKLFHLARWFWSKVQARSEITRYDIKLKVPEL